ncbi:pyocin knob domain-containing protein [Breznakia pachnodae]|uniref:Uncharacterized protein n=1 Tax=Breznakia pachnodae TaxID=265178 RepID=A0ABU0DYP4_9FIRM|nr:pyocin knob domain-containing protein [Breznakia pachnodae]MDQ0359696.1 hypothetical protein [Breznakia pachnodae]
MAILKIKNETTKEWEDIITIKGDKGDKPSHEIDGTKIRFQNPDGTYGEWIELEVLTAEQVPTEDGSNVQTKLNNSFNLGNDSHGNPYMQNIRGYIPLEGKSLDNEIYTGIYYCSNCINRPIEINGWMQVFGGGNDTKQVYHLVGTAQATFTRLKMNGVWGGWKLVSGKILIFSTLANTFTEGNTISLTRTELNMYDRIKVHVATTATPSSIAGVIECSYLEDLLSYTGSNPISGTTTGSELGLGTIKLYAGAVNLTIQVCRSFRIIPSAASATQTLCIKKIEGIV